MRFCQVEHEHPPPISHPAAARIFIWTISGFCAAESDQQQNSWKQVLCFPVCFGLLVFTPDVLVALGLAPKFLQSTHLEDIKAAVINIHISYLFCIMRIIVTVFPPLSISTHVQ
jgi:hypothetical protein